GVAVAAHVVALPKAPGSRRERHRGGRLLPGRPRRRLPRLRRPQRLRGAALADAAPGHPSPRRMAIPPARLWRQGRPRSPDVQARVPDRPREEDPAPLLRRGPPVLLPRRDPRDAPPDRRGDGPGRGHDGLPPRYRRAGARSLVAPRLRDAHLADD